MLPDSAVSATRLHPGGLTVAVDFEQALHWNSLVAALGHSPARARLGHQYACGLGVARSLSEAERWFLAAACRVGECYLHGTGVEPSAAEARRWAAAAVHQGHVPAMVLLGGLARLELALIELVLRVFRSRPMGSETICIGASPRNVPTRISDSPERPVGECGLPGVQSLEGEAL